MHVHTQFLVLAWAMHPHMPALLCSVQTENIECLALTHTFSKRWPGHKPYHIRAKHERGNRQCSHRILISILSALVLQFDLIFTTLDALCCIKLRPSHDYANSDQSTSPRVLEHFNVTTNGGNPDQILSVFENNSRRMLNDVVHRQPKVFDELGMTITYLPLKLLHL